MELKLEHISKEYKNTTALDDFSMTFSEEIYGLLGARMVQEKVP